MEGKANSSFKDCGVKGSVLWHDGVTPFIFGGSAITNWGGVYAPGHGYPDIESL